MLAGYETGQNLNYDRMSIITFELEDLKDFGISKDNIQEIVDMFGMSLEAMDERTATIDITPNRPDMLDITGFSRAAGFFIRKKVPKEKHYSITNSPAMQVKVTTSVKSRPFIAASIVNNVNLGGNRLKYLINFTEKFCETYGRKRKKIAIGLHNLDMIKGDLTYDAASAETEFVPLGSNSKHTFGDIMREHEKGIKYSKILGKSRLYPYLKDLDGNVLSLIPIINSELTRVTNSTKNLLIEITGTSINAVEEAMNMFACSFIDMGSEVRPCNIVYKNKTKITPNLEYKTLKLRRTKVEKTLGVYLDDNKIINLANRLGHVAAKYGNYTLIYSPPYRLDVFNEQDIIEDIAIAYGYDNIKPVPILGFSTGLPERSNEMEGRICRLMLGIGFSEAMNLYLTNEDLNFRNMLHEENKESTIKVAYAKTESITMLRTSLLPHRMQNLGNSMHESMPQRIFEIGNVFHMGSEKPVENTNIGVVSEHSKANYSEIKSVVIEMLKFAGITGYSIKESEDRMYISGRSASVYIKDEKIGDFGEIHPKVLKNFGIEEPVVAAELSLDMVL